MYIHSILYINFESCEASENPASGGWSISQYAKNGTLSAEAGLSNLHYEQPALGIDSHAPLAGTQSGRVTIPPGTTLTLTKLISLPERMPFAVSQHAFSIIKATVPKENKEKEFTHPDEIELRKQSTDESEDLNLRGPHAAIPATTTPVSGRATLYGTTYYIHSYDGKLLAEYDTTGTCVRDYIYMGNKLIAEYQPVIAKYYYYTSDQINSTRIITDST
ncbi:MAG: hypothetical protein MUO31_15675, partial [Thermodesulfovibrionales bacterium]|nr:hypothetical protein [Thermodesulfovibrionales bacterium]